MPAPKVNGKGPDKPKKDLRIYEFRIYTLASGYTGDLELLLTVTHKFKNVYTDSGRPITVAQTCVEEYVHNIGMYGITVEDPQDAFNYYPPNRIAKIEYNEIDQ